MSLSYKPLWDMLAEKGISKMEFAKSVEISNATLAKMGIRVLPNNFDFQIVGNLPHYVKDKIVRFNSFMKTL